MQGSKDDMEIDNQEVKRLQPAPHPPEPPAQVGTLFLFFFSFICPVTELHRELDGLFLACGWNASPRPLISPLKFDSSLRTLTHSMSAPFEFDSSPFLTHTTYNNNNNRFFQKATAGSSNFRPGGRETMPCAC
jgi:hypothetical protein